MARLGFEASKKKTLCSSPIALTPPRYSLTKNWTLLLSQLGLLSLSQKEATTFLQQVFLIALTTVQTTQAILRMYVNKVLHSPNTYIHSIRISNDIFTRLISDSVNIRNFRHDKPFRYSDI